MFFGPAFMLGTLVVGPGQGPDGKVCAAAPQDAPRPAVSVHAGADGRLVYTTDAAGTRVLDFSHAGYGGGGAAIPDVPVRIVVSPDGRRDAARIQAALDLVADMPADARGLRGAVLLTGGRFSIDTDVRVRASGVVLRGSGTGDAGTVLVAAGTDRRSLVVVAGSGERTVDAASRVQVADDYVPSGARSFTLAVAGTFAVGDRVIVHRPSTAAWIARLGMNLFAGWRPENRLHWQPGSRDLEWDRTITAVDGARVTLDAPITTALDRRYGGGSLARYTFPGRIRHAGVEHLRLESAYDPARPLDEDHAWFGITLDRVEHTWIRQVTLKHFAGSAVYVAPGATAVTVEEVAAAAPVSEIGGFRRRVFDIAGQLVLVRRCRSEQGIHDFVAGFASAGPNVFLESRADGALDFSGPLESWASGVLYDNVIIRGNAIRLTNVGTAGQGQGWAAANSVVWNSEATDVEVQSPPDAVNQAYGTKGVVTGDGIVWDPRTMPFRDFYRGMPVAPRSLYLTQLAERLGADAVAAIERRPIGTDPGSSRRLSEADVDAFEARVAASAAGRPAPPLRVEAGAFMLGPDRAWTARTGYSWFQAQMPPALAKIFGPALTRFAPGRIGIGLTDDIAAVAAAMPPRSAFYQHYGLWYDRRRVDHNYYGSPEQRTGDVWAPFMELPWARSGQGKAWDGLSRYDLTRFNPWYFDRVAAFAREADRRGLILYHHFYFQHWLLESRSHYVDFPWRPVNAIQDTGLPDEVPAADVFYDLSSPLRRDLHRRYIRHTLDVLGDRTNVVFGIDREYTGPLPFVQFWLDTIAEWQRERGKTVLVALEIPKDQMDTILDDPVRGPLIAAIDVLGWVYRADGSLFAARGGINRAPREQRPDIATAAELDALKTKLGIAPTDQKDFLSGPEFQRLFDTLWAGSKPMKYRAWREYRDAHPRVVALWEADEYPAVTAAVERLVPTEARAATRPADLVRAPRATAWCLARPGGAYLVYTMAGEPVVLDLRGDPSSYAVRWIDSADGRVIASLTAVKGGTMVTLEPPLPGTARPWIAWMEKR